MHRLKQKFLTIYAFTIFLLCAILGAIPLALVYRTLWSNNEKRKLQFHRLLCGFFRWSATHIPGVKLDLQNPAGEDFCNPAILIANHQSHLDLLCTLMLSPRIIAVTNNWVWNFPLYAPIIHYLEYYPATEGVAASEEKLRSLIGRGYSVLIFPEGTRSADCSILRFHRGAFHLAEQLHTDIIPIFLDSPGKILPKEDFCLQPGTIRVEVGQRVRYGDKSMGETTLEQAKAWRALFKSKIKS